MRTPKFPPFQKRVRLSGNTAVVELVGELDIAVAGSLRSALLELARLDGVSTVAIDLSALRFIDSTGLGVLVDVRQQTVGHGSRFVLLSPSDSASRVLEITGLDRLFEIEAELRLA